MRCERQDRMNVNLFPVVMYPTPTSSLLRPKLTHEPMAYQSKRDNVANYETFRECVSKAILQRSEGQEEPKGRSRRKGKFVTSNSQSHASWTESHNPEEMAEFIDVSYLIFWLCITGNRAKLLLVYCWRDVHFTT